MRKMSLSLFVVLLWAANAFGQLNPLPVPRDNPLDPDAIALGRQLFFDPRLSVNNTVSCATCHDPNHGYADTRSVSLGVGGKAGIRNAPTIFNTGYQRLLFHDGRALLLEGQALGPIQDAGEMGSNLNQLVGELAAVPYYNAEFTRIYGGVTSNNIAKALASFERTIVSYDAPIDRYNRGETWAMDQQQKRGFAVFQRAKCAECHSGQDFRDGQFHNTGSSVGELDEGRFTISRVQADFKKFKTPTLREVGRTDPYFHNGKMATLDDVVEFYNRGGGNDPRKDRRIVPLGLSTQDKADLAHFLRTAFLGEYYPVVVAPALP